MQPLLPHLDAAYHWLCHLRRDFPATTDVWHLRQHWPAERQRLQAELCAGTVTARASVHHHPGRPETAALMGRVRCAGTQGIGAGPMSDAFTNSLGEFD